MTKGITKLFMGAAMLASVATAETDLFAKLSNGALSDKSEGIAELSRAEKAKVVGGYYYVTTTSRFNSRDGGYFFPYSYQTGMIINLDSNDARYFSSVMNYGREDLVMITRYNYSPGGYNHYFGIVDKGSGKIKRTVWNGATAIILQQQRQKAESHNYSNRVPRYW